MLEPNLKSYYFSYEFLSKLKDPKHFWYQNIGCNTYIFDLSNFNIFELKGQLSELFSLTNPTVFNERVNHIEWEEIKQFYYTIDKIINHNQISFDISPSQHIVNDLHININNQCNLACKYCFKSEKKHALADWPIVCKAIDYLIFDCGRDAVSYNVIYGLTGEPLLDFENIKKVLQYIKDLGKKTKKRISFSFLSNGTVLNEVMVKFFSKSKMLPDFHISIDGREEVHDKVRIFPNGQGTFGTIIKNMERIRRYPFKLHANAVITPNYPYPGEVLNDLLSMGFDQILIKPIRPGNSLSFDRMSLESLKKGYLSYYEMVFDDLANYRFQRLIKYRSDFSLKFLEKILLKQKVKRRCRWGVNELVVNHKGEFYPCDSVMDIEEFKIGDVDNGIIWEKYLTNINVEKRASCMSCWCNNLCGGTCFYGAWVTEGDILAVEPIECELNRFMIENSLKLVFKLIHHKAKIGEIKEFFIKTEPAISANISKFQKEIIGNGIERAEFK